MARASKQPSASGNFGVGPRLNQGQAGARKSRPRSSVQSLAGPSRGRRVAASRASAESSPAGRGYPITKPKSRGARVSPARLATSPNVPRARPGQMDADD